MVGTTTFAWSEADFCLGATASEGERYFSDLAGVVYDRVCRTDFLAPGFCLVDLGSDWSSEGFRRFLLALRQQMQPLHRARRERDLVLTLAARFDQQVTTKPHRDGGPDECLLLLGYEPSAVRAEIRMSDYARCAHDCGLTPRDFLEKHNPMFSAGERLLEPYTTRVTCFSNQRYQVLVINNSSAPYSEDVPRWQGVLHTATITNPDESARRIVNSLMVASVLKGMPEPISVTEQEEFAQTTLVRRAGYDKQHLRDDA
jgi:hypothetical protein